MHDPAVAVWPGFERLATAAQMRAMDRRAIEELGLPGRLLMEDAARAVADRVQTLLGGTLPRTPGTSTQAPIAVLCGAGNNGGDGYAVARLLLDRGLPAAVIALGQPRAGGDAAANREAWMHAGRTLEWRPGSEEARALLAAAPLVVDALFGTGLARPLEGGAAALVQAVNAAAAPHVVAVDLPSGVDADTGAVLGCAVRATHTVTFQVGKPGCYQHPGADCCGPVEVAPVSIPRWWAAGEPATWLSTDAGVSTLLPARPAAGHKGTFGHLLAICGSAGMGGAALLAGMGALKSGAGLVTLGVPRCLRDAFVTLAPELMTLAPEAGGAQHFEGAHATELLAAAEARDALALGCGLGRHADTAALVRALLAAWPGPLLLDADGLHHLGAGELAALQGRAQPAVLTPHPGELARLAGLSREEIAADRVGVARRLAAQWGVVLVLKGVGTVIAGPAGDAFINPTGDAGLASGGTGDVLSGIVGSLLAQGLKPLSAAVLGVYLHGLARDVQRETLTATAFTARNLIDGLDAALRRLGAA